MKRGGAGDASKPGAEAAAGPGLWDIEALGNVVVVLGNIAGSIAKIGDIALSYREYQDYRVLHSGFKVYTV